MESITVNILRMLCDDAIKRGYGNKTVLISCDDEGNGYHTLFFGFTTNKEEIKMCEYLFHDNNNPNDVVLLG